MLWILLVVSVWVFFILKSDNLKVVDFDEDDDGVD